VRKASIDSRIEVLEADLKALRTENETLRAALEHYKIIASVCDQFALQLDLKSVNGGEWKVVWAGDLDDISNEKLRQLVGNFLKARTNALTPPGTEKEQG
jgi:hypothetical protein